MKLQKIFGLLLIAAGAIGLAYGQLEYTKESSELKLGPLELSVREKESVKIPPWLGIGAIAVGSLLLVVGGRR